MNLSVVRPLILGAKTEASQVRDPFKKEQLGEIMMRLLFALKDAGLTLEDVSEKGLRREILDAFCAWKGNRSPERILFEYATEGRLDNAIAMAFAATLPPMPETVWESYGFPDEVTFDRAYRNDPEHKPTTPKTRSELK